MNYEFNLLHHFGVVAKRVRAAAAAHEGDDDTPSSPTLIERSLFSVKMNCQPNQSMYFYNLYVKRFR